MCLKSERERERERERGRQFVKWCETTRVHTYITLICVRFITLRFRFKARLVVGPVGL